MVDMNYHELFKKLEIQLQGIEDQKSLRETIGLLIESILRDFSREFGFTGARLYHLDDDCDCYRLESKFGGPSPAEIGFSVPRSYRPIRLLCRQGILYMDRGSRGIDENIETKLGVKRFAAITAGRKNEYIISFSIPDERAEKLDDILFALSSIRHAVNIKLEQEKFENIILQSRQIQLSLLPPGNVDFPGYDIAARSVPAEIVGGDVYDFIKITNGVLGLAIGDATGHGLPAALQARDVLVGLRMGISEDKKMIKVLEKLNNVIHASRLTSRYISLFYGELSPGGHFIFSNAGHNPPFYYRRKKDRFYPMSDGGMVLGPTKDATYLRGFFKINPDDAVIMYTDGVTEAKNLSGEDFGEERVKDFVRANHGRLNAMEMVRGLLEEVDKWSEGGDYIDDRTALYVRRLG